MYIYPKVEHSALALPLRRPMVPGLAERRPANRCGRASRGDTHGRSPNRAEEREDGRRALPGGDAPRDREVPKQRPEGLVTDIHVRKLRPVREPAELLREAEPERAEAAQRSNRTPKRELTPPAPAARDQGNVQQLLQLRECTGEHEGLAREGRRRRLRARPPDTRSSAGTRNPRCRPADTGAPSPKGARRRRRNRST